MSPLLLDKTVVPYFEEMLDIGNSLLSLTVAVISFVSSSMNKYNLDSSVGTEDPREKKTQYFFASVSISTCDFMQVREDFRNMANSLNFVWK